MTSFSIGPHSVGPGHPCFVIAEAGSNHNGSLEQALKLIDVAAEAEANAVKFQTFRASRLYTPKAGTSDYLGDPRSIFSIIEQMEMPSEWLPKLAEHTRAAGLAFLSSPFHEEAVGLLTPHVDAFKVASYELTHAPLLKEVAAAKKPVILSTGASEFAEVKAAVELLRRSGVDRLAVLQCTAAYPAPLGSIHLRTIPTLAQGLGVLAGLSDHSRDPEVAPSGAVALGAVAVEKHFTLSNRLPGPDHPFAIEPLELKRMVARIRAMEMALGRSEKAVDPVEQELRAFARRSLFTTRSVPRGEVFSRENVDVLRHGKQASGLAPEHLEAVLGRPAARTLEAHQPLASEDVEGGVPVSR